MNTWEAAKIDDTKVGDHICELIKEVTVLGKVLYSADNLGEFAAQKTGPVFVCGDRIGLQAFLHAPRNNTQQRDHHHPSVANRDWPRARYVGKRCYFGLDEMDEARKRDAYFGAWKMCSLPFKHDMDTSKIFLYPAQFHGTVKSGFKVLNVWSKCSAVRRSELMKQLAAKIREANRQKGIDLCVTGNTVFTHLESIETKIRTILEGTEEFFCFKDFGNLFLSLVKTYKKKVVTDVPTKLGLHLYSGLWWWMLRAFGGEKELVGLNSTGIQDFHRNLPEAVSRFSYCGAVSEELGEAVAAMQKMKVTRQLKKDPQPIRTVLQNVDLSKSTQSMVDNKPIKATRVLQESQYHLRDVIVHQSVMGTTQEKPDDGHRTAIVAMLQTVGRIKDWAEAFGVDFDSLFTFHSDLSFSTHIFSDVLGENHTPLVVCNSKSESRKNLNGPEVSYKRWHNGLVLCFGKCNEAKEMKQMYAYLKSI